MSCVGQGQGQNVRPGFQKTLQDETTYAHTQRAAEKSRDTFSSISRRKPECAPRSLPGIHFQAFPGANQNVGSESFQRQIFNHFQAQARMCAQKASRDTFSNISRRKPECGTRTLPETQFQSFPGPFPAAGENVGAESFQKHRFNNFQAQTRM